MCAFRRGGWLLAVAMFLGVIWLGTPAREALAQPGSARVDFESSAEGVLDRNAIKLLWPGLEWADIQERARIVPTGDRQRGRVLQVAYPRGSVGSSQGGSQFLVRIPPAEEYWLSYRLKFEPGFDFRLGGKLPGLTSGGGKYTGGTRPVDGEGWSARYMWRREGQAVIYLYYVDMKGQFGDDLPLEGIQFQPGQWYTLTQHIRLNRPNESNGLLEVWCDGKPVLSRSDIRFRIGEQGLIDSFYFSTFHGGSSAEWAPQVDCLASFDDFTLSTSRPADLDGQDASAGGTSQGSRAFTLANGATLEGRVTGFNARNQTVTFERTNGTTLRSLPLKRFSDADQQAIRAEYAEEDR